jgi:hypothetical protein
MVLSQKAVNAYRRENPGSKLQTAVTEDKPKGKRAKRSCIILPSYERYEIKTDFCQDCKRSRFKNQ